MMRDLKQPKASKKPSVEGIYTQILQAIFERKLSPGLRLKEEELSEVFQVGRATIRTVLQRLALEKLVNLVPNSGAFIAEPSISESREVFEARRLIEKELVRALAGNFNADKKARLLAHVEREHAADAKGEHSLRIRLSGEYHLLIGELAEKPVLTEFLREIIPRTSLIIALYERVSYESDETNTHCDHQVLIDVLETGDADRAEVLMLDHLRAIEDKLSLEPPTEKEVDLRQIFNKG
ncbi:GntR family transcriptional regulator [Parasalinivibrio latis]|uniref:GntR family transcriptional regulator n=1 Tax=Parasalinivibrio latis TaxID=2952610 RepID=UPI0030E44C1C